MNTLLRWRRLIVALLHLSLVAASNYAAFWLRFDGDLPGDEVQHFLQALPWLLLIRGLAFYRFRLFQGLWRYTSLWDLRNIVLAVGFSTTIFYIVIHVMFGMKVYPRSVMLIDPLLLVCLMAGVRLAHRMFPTLLPTLRPADAPPTRRVLVVGAGDAAEMIVREMRRHPEYGHEPVGFVEDDPQLQGQWIHGVPVLGGVRDLVRIMLTTHPHEVLIAFAQEEPAAIRAIVRLLEPFKVPLTRMPQIEDLVNGRAAGSATVGHIRQLRVEDLLARAPIGLDITPVRRLIEGRRVLVTGAGGSIGSELCRQIAGWSPARLVLFERYENGLYTIESQLRDKYPDGPFAAAIGDVTDVDRLDAVLRAERPDIIFHAAAHKHVPLMEMNPCEAVKNNALGTLRVAEAAVHHNVGAFVLISTDKAVHPSSVMGATKRIAETIVQSLNGHHVTRFMTVRFGNVLGSSGSVVPRFLAQIEAGGPVTVTHPEIQRYFMLIPEAVQLVLQAAAIGEPGGVYVLDMGEQIKLVEMARNLIRLSGRIPDEEIAIRFIGLRPGEKLSEQLVSDEEAAEPSAVEKIQRVRPRDAQRHAQTGRALSLELARLTQAAMSGNAEELLRQMQRMVPSFVPVGQAGDAAGVALAAAAASRTAALPTAPRRPLMMTVGKSAKSGSSGNVRPGVGAAAILLCLAGLLADSACKSNPSPPAGTTPQPGTRSEYFVSPDGLPTNDGSPTRPLDLATALSKQSPVQPGQRIWVRGGTYRGAFVSYVNGAPNSPIVVRNYQGERAILDGSNPDAQDHGIVLQVLGTHTWFWGLELTYSNPARIDTGNPSGPNGVYANESNDVKFINMIVHDLPGQGFGVWSESVNVEVYGNIIYYNGTNGFDHGIYAQNENETKRIEDNVIFDQASHGLHAYGSTNAFLDHFLISGNVSFNNGLLIGDPQRNLLVGGGRVAHDLKLTDNFTYFPPASARGSNNIGYAAGCADATVTGNAFVGPNALTLVNCAPMLTNNVFVGTLDPPDLSARYGDNAYLPSLPMDERVIVRANRYEPGRANVIVYNWDLETQVAVNLAPTGLRNGQGFEIRDVQALFDPPILTGTFTGAPVAVPMTGLHTAAPVWNRAVPPRHTAPEFGVYLVLPR